MGTTFSLKMSENFNKKLGKGFDTFNFRRKKHLPSDEVKMDNIKRIESILMSFMVDGRADLEESGNKFIHYTSADNAINILKSKRLWMRNPKCMNDYMEIIHGYQHLDNYFKLDANKELFSLALNQYEEGFLDHVFAGFNDWWKQVQLDTFITSVSVHLPSEDKHGRLSMWRAYGESPAKAALVLNNPPEAINSLNLILSPALYLTEEEINQDLDNLANNFVAEIEFIRTLDREEILSNLILSLIVRALSLKHVGFKEEREWRIIFLPNLFPQNKLVEKGLETVSGVPQVIHKIPLEYYPEEDVSHMSIPQLLDKVIIGPTTYPITILDAFNVVINEAGINPVDGKVVSSGIPLRT